MSLPSARPSIPFDVDAALRLPEEDFARQCDFKPHRSGGPGGQKRNKTSSAVRLVHRPTGLEADSGEFRSQVENRRRALHRLRLRLALDLRGSVVLARYQPPEWIRPYTAGGMLHVNRRNPDFARVAAHALDLAHATDGNVARSAALLGVSASSLVKWLRRDAEVWRSFADIRRAAGLPVDPFAR